MEPVSTTASPVARTIVPASHDPLVSFVIVTYGTGAIVVDAIESLVATAGSRAVEVIVVDNAHPRAGDRAFTELLLATAGVRVVRPPVNLGFGGGCELGALHARGGYLAFVNPDVVALDGWLQPLLAVLDADPTVSIAAPVLLDPDGAIQECGQRLFADGTTRPHLHVPPAASGPVTVDYASAACWVMRAAEHERIGGFDPAFFPAYFEDVDLALRARLLGGRCVVVPSARVVHRIGSGTADRPAPAHAQRELLVARWTSIAHTQSPASSS
jgi:GT2 family glycosyltransferase